MSGITRAIAALALTSAWSLPASTWPSAIHFPAGFLWGTATSAVQCEGGTVHSDWETFQRRPHAIRTSEQIGAAAKAYDTYESDYQAASAMHTNAYRFSIEWSRLEPTRGHFDAHAATHYRAMLLSLRAKGIRPMVTLHHFSNPDWVAAQGGWLNPLTIDDFETFACYAAQTFGDLVDDWITINEPSIYVGEGYLDGAFPPGYQGDFKDVPRVLANMAKAHGRAYHALHRYDVIQAAPNEPACSVGIADHMVAFQAEAPWNPLDLVVKAINEDWVNFCFLNAACTGEIRFDTLVGRDYEQVPALAHTLDFVGVNYYTRSLSSILAPFSRNAEPGKPKTDLGLEIYPDGLTQVLEAAYTRYHLPIYITEMGLADAGRKQTPAFMVQHLARVGNAIAEGIPVKGVFWWSLMDNFEWQYGTSGRFGLLAVDFSRPDCPRSWTPGAFVYARIARENQIDPDLRASYPERARVPVACAR
jgi:beta-glucosidase